MWGDGSARLRFVSEIRCSYVRQTNGVIHQCGHSLCAVSADWGQTGLLCFKASFARLVACGTSRFVPRFLIYIYTIFNAKPLQSETRMTASVLKQDPNT